MKFLIRTSRPPARCPLFYRKRAKPCAANLVTVVRVESAERIEPDTHEFLGIVDMGSGSARLVVYQFERQRWYRLTDEIREGVRLGEGFAASGRLSDAAVDRALDALKLYTDYASATELGKLLVIATSAVREAANRAEFLSKLKDFNLEFVVLSGEDEARYGALAVANSFSLPNAWVMDLGGGSAQLSRLEDRVFQGGAAYPLGYVRMTEQFLKQERTSDNEVRDLEKFAKLTLGKTLRQLERNPSPLIAMGGTIRNLAKAVQKSENYPLDMLHGYFLTRQKLEALIERLLELPANERSKISGIHVDRADAILGGALVYRTVLREANLEGVFTTDPAHRARQAALQATISTVATAAWLRRERTRVADGGRDAARHWHDGQLLRPSQAQRVFNIERSDAGLLAPRARAGRVTSAVPPQRRPQTRRVQSAAASRRRPAPDALGGLPAPSRVFGALEGRTRAESRDQH